MIFFDRGYARPPESLTSSKSMAQIEHVVQDFMTLDPERRAQTDIPAIWKTPFEEDVMANLRTITGGKCAFCMTHDATRVYRFRPPAYAEPVKPIEHEASYLWCAFQWDNLFPICDGCVPKQKNYFPVNGEREGHASFDADREEAQLISPGELSQPYRSFKALSDGTLGGLTKRARLTIEHFQLNTPDKKNGRERELGLELGHLMSMVRGEERKLGEPLRVWAPLLSSSLGFWYLYLRRVIKSVPMRPPGSLSQKSIHMTVKQMAVNAAFQRELEEAIQRVRDEDASATPESSGDTAAGARALPQADPVPPRIAHVALTQYKSLEEISFDIAAELSPTTLSRLTANAETTTGLPEAPCVLILGENATGKSSILEAIALALIPSGERDGLFLKPSRLTLNTEYMGALEGAPVPQSEIRIGFHPDPNQPTIAGRQVSLTIDGAADPAEAYSAGGDRTGPLPPVFAYGAHRLYGGEDRRAPLRHIETLFFNDRQLPRPETWLRTLSRADLDQVARALRHIIQIDGEFHTIEAPVNSDHCRINIEKTRADGSTYIVPQRLDIVSSGYRAIFALVCDVLEGLVNHTASDVATARATPAIVMIDEIEAHLHPRWKLHVISGLRRALPKVTFIITSHDPLCVRGMYDGEVLALNRYQNVEGAGLGVPERVEKVAGFENVETLTIEQLLTSELFQLLSTDNPEMDRSLARAADKLSQTPGEAPAAALEEIDMILSTALPFGQTELARVVQQAVAEYLAERRQRDQGANAKARAKAKEEIKQRLRELMQ